MTFSMSNISYCETGVFTDSGKPAFMGQFPSGSKHCTYTKNLPLDGSKVFDIDLSLLEFESQFYNFLAALVKKNFGLIDFMYFMKSISPEMTAQSFYDWYSSLYYKSSSLENNVCVSIIGSTMDDTFSKKTFLKDITAPQEALDTFIFLKNKNTIYTILAYKRKTDSINVTFSDGRSINILRTGLFGNVICGENLEMGEKVQMNANWDKYNQNKTDTGLEYLKLNLKSVSAAIRGLLEELKFIPDENFTPYIVGKDTVPARDERYWVFGDNDEFGYERPSESTMIAFVGHCAKPELDEPLDTYECSKGSVVDLEYALREFRVGGQLDCAFPSHPRMLGNVAKMLPDLFQ